MTDLNKNSTLANNPVSSITPVDNLPPENPSKYDEVLNQYSQSKPEETVSESKSNSWAENLPKTESEIKTESIPETPIETTPTVEPAPQPEITPEPENETFLKPQPEIEVTPEPEFLNKTPDQIKQEISQILDNTSTDSSSNIIPPSTSKINLFQILFVVSLVIFLIVVSAVVFTYFKSQKTPSEIRDLTSDISITPTPSSSITCFLNDKTYKIGESFLSADGCNTCSCSENGSIACTEKACANTPTITKSATTSAIPKDWKTYTNSIYKFAFNYPSTLKITESSRIFQDNMGASCQTINLGSFIKFYVCDEAKNLSDYGLLPPNGMDPIADYDFTIGGQKAKKYVGGDDSLSYVTMSPSKNRVDIHIIKSNLPDKTTELENILKTFKFN